MPNCKVCGWWKWIESDSKVNGVKQGRCYGRAPTATPVIMPVVNQITNEVKPQIIEVTIRPVVPADCDICGDFVDVLALADRS